MTETAPPHSASQAATDAPTAPAPTNRTFLVLKAYAPVAGIPTAATSQLPPNNADVCRKDWRYAQLFGSIVAHDLKLEATIVA
jgi:hypothetical protein